MSDAPIPPWDRHPEDQLRPMPSDERLLAIALDGERMAGESKEHADKRYYADVAAACRAVIAARALLTDARCDVFELHAQMSAILGPTGGGDEAE